MNKQTQPLAFMWFVGLGIFLCLLTSYDTNSPTFSPTPTPNATEQMATVTA